MIGRALALGLTTLLFASQAVFADETPDSMGDVDIPAEEEEEAEPPNWARTGLYLEFDGQFIADDFRQTTNRGKPKSGVGGGLAVRAGWRVGRPLAFEIAYERVFDLLDDYDANLMTINAKYLILTDRRYQPFLRTGLGIIWGDLPMSWTRRPDGTQSAFVWKVGAGLDYAITEHWIASLYGDYVIPTQEFHKLNYGAVGLGVRYKF
jgi:opacity protein-like surface antigen